MDESSETGSAPESAGGRDPQAPATTPGARRPPGRPALMTREAVLGRIRELSGRDDGLFRAHQRHPALYARARRMFGSWSAAIAAAGLDYVDLVVVARARAVRTRRQRARRPSGPRP